MQYLVSKKEYIPQFEEFYYSKPVLIETKNTNEGFEEAIEKLGYAVLSEGNNLSVHDNIEKKSIEEFSQYFFDLKEKTILSPVHTNKLKDICDSLDKLIEDEKAV